MPGSISFGSLTNRKGAENNTYIGSNDKGMGILQQINKQNSIFFNNPDNPAKGKENYDSLFSGKIGSGHFSGLV